MQFLLNFSSLIFLVVLFSGIYWLAFKEIEGDRKGVINERKNKETTSKET